MVAMEHVRVEVDAIGPNDRSASGLYRDPCEQVRVVQGLDDGTPTPTLASSVIHILR
jgi:hypothetical protein